MTAAEVITCPSWCVYPGQHVVEEPDGCYTHHSDMVDVPTYDGGEITVMLAHYIDRGEPEPPIVRLDDRYLTVDQARRLIYVLGHMVGDLDRD